MTEAVRQASLFEAALRKASTNKGISFLTLNQELTKAGTSAEQLITTLGTAGPEFSDSFNVALQSLATADRSIISISNKVAEMKRVLTQSIKFTAAAQLQDAFVSAIQECIRWVEELNKELTMISVVTGKTAGEMDKVYDNVVEGAQKLRVAASDYAEASLIFYQQGLDDNEVQKRTDITIKAAQAAGSSTQEMSKQLTAVWNTYQMAGDEMQRAASVGAKLAADTAVDFKDIAEGMQISATAAAQMGVSYDSLAAIIATVGDTTQQSASVIGNAYKTIFSRFQQLKVEGTDGEVTLNRVSQQLSDVGIQVLDSAGNLRELDDVIMEVGLGWDNYTEKQQLAIAEIVGGTRQYGQFLALMQNFDKYVELLGVAQNEDGSELESQYEAAQQSVEVAATNAAEAWNRAFGEVIDDDLLKGFYNGLEEVGDIVGDILQGMGGFEGILTLAGTLLSRNIIPKLNQAVAAIKTIRANSTIEGRQAQVEASGQQMQSSLKQVTQQRLAEAKTDRQKYQISFNADNAGFKIDTWTQIGKAQQQINAMIDSGNDSLKIQGQYLAERLKTYGEMINKASDALEVARQELQVEKETTQTIIDRIKNSQTPVNDTSISDKITENNARLSDIQVEKQVYTEAFDNSKDDAENQKIMDRYLELEREEEVIKRINAELEKKNKILAQNEAGALEIQKAFMGIADAAAKATLTSDGIIDKKTIKNLSSDLEKGMRDAGIGKRLRKSIQEDLSGLTNSGELTKTIESMRGKLEAALSGKKISTESYNAIIQALDKIEQGTNGVSAVSKNLASQLDGLKISATQVTSAATQASFALTGIATAVSSGWSAALEGNILGVVSALSSIGMQLPTLLSSLGTLKSAFSSLGAVTKLNAAANELFTASTVSVTGAQITLNETEKQALIQKQLADMADTVGIANAERMSIADLQAALAKKGLTVSINQNTGAVTANTAAWMTNPIGWIVAAIMAVIAVFTIWNKIIQMNTEAQEKNVEKCQEQVDKYSELSSTINENTTAVEENISAYKEALATGQDTVKTYNDMVDSLNELNDSLIEAGANSQDLSQAMTTALVTGDMTQYYEEVSKAQTQIYKDQMDSIEELNKAQLKLAKSQMTKAFDFNGPEKTTIANTVYAQGQVVSEPSQALKDVAKDSDLLTDTGTSVELNLEFNNVTEFREQYQELVRIKEELEDTGAAQSEINAINDQIEGLTETYNSLDESIKEAQSTMESMMSTSIQNSGYDFGSVDLNSQIGYIQQVYNEMRKQGEALGMTNEEIENSFNNVIAKVPELNSALASLNQVNTIMENVMSGDKSFSDSSTETQSQIKQTTEEIENLQSVLNEAGEKTGIGKWFNGLSAEEEYIKDTLGKTKEEVEQELSDLQDDLLEKQERLKQEIQDTFNAMTPEERELLLKVGVDFVDDKQDLQQMLDNIEDLKLKVNVEFKNEDELRQQFDEDQTTQDNMGTAISEYQENGFVTTDTAKEMIDNGMGEYLMVVNDQFVLTTGAAEAYNASIERQKQNVQELLGLTTELRAPTEDFATAMASVRATMDNDVLEGYAQGLEDISVKFLNSEGSAQDMITYFQDLQTQITNSKDAIQQELNDLSDDQLRQVLSTFESLGTNLADTMAKANAAVSAGQMNIGEYRDALVAAGAAQRSAAESARDIADENLMDTIRETNEALGIQEDSYINTTDGLRDYIKEQKKSTKEGSKERKQLEETEAILNDVQDAYDGVTDSIEDYDEAMSDLDALEDFTDAVTENYEQLQGILNDDFSLKFDIGDLDTSQLDVLQTIIQSALDSTANLSEEAAQRVAQAMIDTTNGMGSLIIKGTTYTKDSLVQALKNGQISAQDIMATGNAAANALLQQVATENENAITSSSQAIGTLISAVGDLISNFQAQIKVTIADSTLDLTPSWSGPLDLGWKLIKGEQVSIAPSGSLTFDISGGLTGDSASSFQSALTNAANFFNSNGAGGLTDGVPSLGDYGTQTPTMADPTDFQPEDGVTKDNGSKGGGGSEFSPTEVIDPEDEDKVFERYEDLTKAIDALTDSMEDLSSAADDAWGARKVRAMQQYNAQIQKQAKLQKELIAETKKYLKEDKEALLNSSKDIKEIAEFGPGDEGQLLNPEAIRRYIDGQKELAAQELANAQNKYNAARDTSKAAEEALDLAKTKYDDRIAELEKQNELLDQLQETEELYVERMNDQIDAIRDWMSNKVEEATYRMEFEITINDRDISWLEHMIDRWGDIGLQTGKTWDWLNQTANDAFDNFTATEKNANRMLEILSNINNPDNQKWFKDTFGDEAWNEYMYTGKMPEEVMSQLEGDWDDMLSFAEDIYDAAEKMLESYVTTLESFMDDFDKIADKLQQQNDRLDMYQELLELSGQQYGESGRQARQDLANAKFDNAATEVERAAGALEVAKAGAEEAQKTLDEFYAEHGKDPNNWTTGEAFFANSLEQQLEEANSILADAQGDMTASIQELAQAAADAMEVMAETIKEEIVENLGGDFVDFDSMTTMYDQQYDLDHFFLEDYDKNYQLDKLLGQIDDQMENITDPARMEEYKKLIDEINAANQEGVDITQTDVDLLNAKFELQKAQDAYEEAQNAKNTMRLARDASGNWNYVYSTDESQTEDAAQALADAQYNYDKLLHEARDESSELWMQAQQEFFEFQETIDRARYESDEKYRAQIDQQMAYYQEKTRLYSEQIIKYNGMLGDDFKDTTLGVITNYGSMEEAQAAYTTQHENYNNQLNESNTLYQEKVKEICDKVGINYEDLAGEIETETEKMQASNNQLKENIKDLSTQGTNALRKLGEETRSWANNMISMIDMVEQSLAKLKNTLDSLGEASLEEMDRGTGFNAMTDYTAVIGNYLYDNLVGPGSANGIWSAEEKREWAMDQLENGYLGDVVAELHNKINDEMLASLGHTVVGHQSWDETIANIKKMIEAAIAGTLERAENEIDESEASKEYNDKYGNTSQIGFATGALVTKPITANLAEDGAELVLNSDDTKNILAAVKTMREVVSFKINQVSANLGQKVESGIDKTIITNDNQQIDQQVHIDATFPNVSVAAEIEEAFSNLVNQAVQYASSKNRKS